jgi:L-asparaginase/Glu-tRNA(Gln) amidotransferase subunit D
MSKLSNMQAEALIKLRDHGPRSAYPGLHMGTLKSLAQRGLVVESYGPGSMSMPHTSIIWRITSAGRAALSEPHP